MALNEIADGIPQFNSGHISIQRWLEQIEQHRTIHNWDSAQVLQYAVNRLGDVPRFWYETYEETVKDRDWDTFRRDIVEAFTVRLDTLDLHAVLVNRTKRPEESYDSFVEDMVELSKLGSLPEETVVRYIIAGLTDPHDIEIVTAVDPQTVAHLLATLRTFDQTPDDSDLLSRVVVVPTAATIQKWGKCFGECEPTSDPGAIPHEKWWVTTLQISIPFFIAGIGTIAAGIILGRVEQWKVFEIVTELFILVPALLGLKGNLDMCLASRLSTQANLGNMVGVGEITHMVLGNIALVQVQATVAAFLVSLFAIGVGAAINGLFLIEHALLLTASAMFTANLSCFVLDFVIVAVILLSNRLKLNPDNLATPMAASIGDMVAISLLSFIASTLFEHLYTHLWVTYIIIGCFVLLLPFWIFIVLKNRYTRPVLKSGWIPVLSALFISSLGGLVLNAAVGMFSGFVVFQPIINGIGGNLVSVQASKLSTMLHQSTTFGTVPSFTKIFENPWKALFKGAPSAKTSRILILMSIPGQVLFIFLADLIHMSESTIGAPFVFSYLLASLIQVMLLLYIAHVIIHAMWKWKIDPDSAAIPYLTALGDLFGTSLLLVAFIFIEAVGHPYDYPIANYVHNFF
ncbi:hypothetical protein pipiens_009551 [Culex pipiens pipiens]|uniref:SLC41A/MgtE integral membrane domain-containing protein n=3 Tax=Culex pipiens TaxID=7175 RepID=A0ABD1DEJ5_CULPP